MGLSSKSYLLVPPLVLLILTLDFYERQVFEFLFGFISICYGRIITFFLYKNVYLQQILIHFNNSFNNSFNHLIKYKVGQGRYEKRILVSLIITKTTHKN